MSGGAMEFVTEQDAAKYAAGCAAVERHLRDGMKVGLGSGTTSHWFVRRLAEEVRSGLDIVGVYSSSATRDLALELGVPLADLDELGTLDITIDGPDEVDPDGAMIKGGGACLLWEKIVATASERMVCIADPSKEVEVLGAFPLPIEVIRFGWTTTRRHLAELLEQTGYPDPALPRREVSGEPVVTDSGHYIVDAHLDRIPDKERLARELNTIPGVVEHGLFIGIADEVIIGRSDGSAEARTLARRG